MDRDALGRVVDKDRLREPHLAFLQTGQTVGDNFREHGQNAVGEIDACPGGFKPPRRAQSPALGRNARRRQCALPAASLPSSVCESEIASSKSRASIRSMVTIIPSVRSSVVLRLRDSSNCVGLLAGLFQQESRETHRAIRTRARSKMCRLPWGILRGSQHLSEHPPPRPGGATEN